MKEFLRYTKMAALPLMLLLPLVAQDKASKDSKLPMTKEQGDAILDELRQIRQLLQAQAEKNAPAPPSRAKLDLSGFQMLG